MNSSSLLSVFKATPLPMLVLLADSPRFTISEVNLAYLKNCHKKEKDIIGKSIFEFLSQTCKNETQGFSGLHKSLEKVVSSKIADKIPIHKYKSHLNIKSKSIKRYSGFENIPVLTDEGEVKYIIHTPVELSEEENRVSEEGKSVKTRQGNAIPFEETTEDIASKESPKLSLEVDNLRYYYASQASFDAVYDWDCINDRSYWGEGYIRDFGYDAVALADKDFWEKHIHPEDNGRILNKLDQLLSGTASRSLCEYRFQKNDGSYAHVLDRSIIIRDENGRAIRFIGAVQDITEKKNLQSLLNKANKLARIGSWEVDVESATVYWSDIVKEIRETSENFEPTLREGISHFKEGYSKDTIIKKVKEAAKYGTPWQEDLQIYTHKGNLKWIRTIGKAEIVDGKCKKIYGSFQDIDESKKAELEIVRLYEEKNTILESIGDAFFRVENNWIITYWNKEAEKLLQIPRKKVIGQNLWRIFPNRIGTSLYKKYHESIETNKRVVIEDYSDVLDKWFEITAYPSDEGLSVYFRDVTERKLSHLRLNESEKRYSELFRLNPQPTWVFELETFRFVQVNKATIDLYGFSEDEFLKMTVFDVHPKGDRAALKKYLQTYGEQPTTFFTQSRHYTKSKKLLEVEVHANFIATNNKKYRLVIITDITEKKRMEQEVTSAIIKTQENERYEVGAELHDNICQILASTHMSLGVLAKFVNHPGIELFNRCREYINLATRETRNLSHRLAPAFFNDTTLEEAFEILLNSCNVENKYAISLYFDEEMKNVNISRDLQLNLYRILQEQLRNILKYSQCKTIKTDLTLKNNTMKMRIADNGIGFDIKAIKGGIGMTNMKRRVELFYGKFHIISSPGKGCKIVIEIPLKQEDFSGKKKPTPLMSKDSF